MQQIRQRLLLTALTVLVVFVATAVSAGYGALKLTVVSPIDELQHFDYAYKVYEGDILPSSPFMSGFSLTQDACRGDMFHAPNAATCAAGVPRADTVDTAHVNYELKYTPLYYATIAAGMHVLHPFGVGLFDAARLTSAFLFGVSCCLLALALVRLGISRRLTLGLVLALSFIPSVQYWGSTVAPDSCAILFGALGLIVLTQRMSARKRAMFGAAVGAAAAITSPNLVPIGMLAAAAACVLPHGLLSPGELPHMPPPDAGRTASARRPSGLFRVPRGRELAVAIALAVAPVVIAELWNEFRYLQLPAVKTVDHQLGAIIEHTTKSLPALLAQATATFAQPFGTSFIVPSRDVGNAICTLLGAVLFGGSVLLVVMGRQRSGSLAHVLATGYLCTLVVDAVFVVVPFYVSFHAADDNSRFAVQLLPLATAAIAVVLDRGAWRWIVLAGGIVTAVYFVANVSPS